MCSMTEHAQRTRGPHRESKASLFGGAACRTREYYGQSHESSGAVYNNKNRLFGEFDGSLAFSRQIFGYTSAAAPATGTSSVISGAPGEDRDDHAGNICAARLSSETSTVKGENEMMWTEAWRKAGDRGEDECPICMCHMEPVVFSTEKAKIKDGSALTISLLVPQPPTETVENYIPEKHPPVADGAVNTRAAVGVEETVASAEGGERGMVGRGDREFQTTGRGRRRNNHSATEENDGATSTALCSTSSSSLRVVVAPARSQGGEHTRQRRRRTGDCDGGGDGGGKKRERLLLSCSHAFHKAVRVDLRASERAARWTRIAMAGERGRVGVPSAVLKALFVPSTWIDALSCLLILSRMSRG